MSEILTILDRVASTSSRNEKEAILKEHASNDTLKRVFKFAYDNQIIFWLTEAPKDSELALVEAQQGLWSIDDALDRVEEVICTREVTGNAADQEVQAILRHLSTEDREVVRRVLQKDLRVGASASTANKVWKNLIPEPEFMLAETDDKKIVYPAISQIKEDSTRTKLVFDGFNVAFVTRNGNDIETHRMFDGFAQTYLEPGDRVDGELMAVDSFGNRLPRKISNGIVGKAVKGKISKEEAKQLRFVVWDLENREGGYHKRLLTLEEIVHRSRTHLIEVVETRIVDNLDQAKAHYKEARRRGLEGTLLKNAAAPWQGKRTFDCVKFKAEYEGEFKVTGYEFGTGKNSARIGKLTFESRCGEIKGKVGIFKDFPVTVREDWMTDLPNIVTIRYNERITEEGEDTESLYLPRVIAVRDDKDEANSRDELIKQEKNAL